MGLFGPRGVTQTPLQQAKAQINPQPAIKDNYFNWTVAAVKAQPVRAAANATKNAQGFGKTLPVIATAVAAIAYPFIALAAAIAEAVISVPKAAIELVNYGRVKAREHEIKTGKYEAKLKAKAANAKEAKKTSTFKKVAVGYSIASTIAAIAAGVSYFLKERNALPVCPIDGKAAEQARINATNFGFTYWH